MVDEIVGGRALDMETNLEIAQCRVSADRLSSAIDHVDVTAMEVQLTGLRAALSRSQGGDDRLVLEQLDALRAVIEAVEHSLDELRSVARREADRLQAAASLLRKLPFGRRLPETGHLC